MKWLVSIFLICNLSIAKSQSALLTLEVLNNEYEVNDSIRVDVRCLGFEDIAAFQFGLKYDTIALELIGISLPSPMSIPMADLGDSIFVDGTDTIHIPDCVMGNFGVCTNGQIRILWTYPPATSTADSSLLFSFHFSTHDDGILSNDLTLSTSIMNPLAYSFDTILHLIPLEYVYITPNLISGLNNITNTKSISIYPNPFIDVVNVSVPGVHIFQLYSTLGNLIEYIKFEDNLQWRCIVPSGTYFVRIDNSMYTIIKN